MSTKYECPNCNYVVEFKNFRITVDVVCPMEELTDDKFGYL